MAKAQGRINRVLAAVAITVMVVGVAVVGQASAPAWAASYPSWSDVQNARNSEAAKKAQIVKLEALLRQLESNVAATQAESERTGDEFYRAQMAYDEAAYKAEQLQIEADAKQVIADESMRKAGQMIARSQRAAGNDLSAQLFFNESGTKDLLSQLGIASKVSEQSNSVYLKAKRDQNTAAALGEQAKVAQEALKGLADVAQAAMVAAQAAADAATAALDEQAGNQERLQAQLSSLIEDRQLTEAQFAQGEQIRLAAEAAERERLRKIAAAAQAAADAAAAAGGGSSGGGVASSGWARPASGYASENSYGPRVPPINGASSWHMGTDFGAGCNQPIYAAASGRVNYAGYNGGYGNFISIDHGGGVTTSYAHIVYGGILVGNGQQVSVGQVIARVGNTGVSGGCHLHFEVRQYGTATNPVYFLRARGVAI